MPCQSCLLKSNLSNYMPSYHVLLYQICLYKYLDIHCIGTYLPFHLFFYPASDPLERASSTPFTHSLPIAEMLRPRWLRGRGQALRARRRNGSWPWNAVRF